MQDELFYVGQKAFVNKDSKLLVLIDPQYGLDLPGGKVQIGESDLQQSFLRELSEEVGVEIKIDKPFYTWLWDLRGDTSRFKHQILLIGYLCEYVSGDIKLSPEHSEYLWVDKNMYKEVLKPKWNDNDAICKAIKVYFDTV